MPLLGNYDPTKTRPPFVEDGSYEFEVVDGKKDITFEHKTPYWALDVKVLKSNNEQHPVGTTATISIMALGFSYANTVYEMFSAVTGHPPSKLSEAAIELFLTSLKGKIVGRKFSCLRTTKHGVAKKDSAKKKKGDPTSWAEWAFGSLDAAPVALS